MTFSRIGAGFFGAWLVLGGSAGANAGPAAEGPEAAPAEPKGAADEAGPTEAKPKATATISAASVRRDMEEEMASLGDLASEAKRDSDLVRAACVLDKQERAQGVMELATGELLVIRDEGSTAEARSFATEKLVAASERLGGLVEQARECMGDKSPEESDDETRNEVDTPQAIPIEDPTVGGGVGGGKPPPLPPPVDDTVPPVVGSPSM